MQTQDKHQALIEATGRGVVTAQPDIALLRLGVATQAKEPGAATDENAKIVAKVIAAIKQAGIPEGQIQTAGLSLQPVYEWDEPNRRNVLIGYRAENNVTVRTPIERAGKVYDAGIQAGANEAGGIVFTIQDDTKYRRAALAEATRLATDEVQTVAKALGVGLVGPVQAQVLVDGGPRPFEASLRKADVETPILPGQLEIVEQVRVVFEFARK